MNQSERCLLLGRDYKVYGNIDYCQLDGKTACTISVGSDKNSPSLSSKGDRQYPNEDAVLIKRQGNQLLLAVADSHFGHYASHSILQALAEDKRPIPNVSALLEIINSLDEKYKEPGARSATTLCIACVNNNNGNGFGVSYGDSSVMLVNNMEAVRINERNGRYITLNVPSLMDASMADQFDFKMQPNEMLMLFTDGIDECHYGQPETSVNEAHILDLFQNHSEDINQYIIQLTGMALSGIDGNPGGQDNIAVAAFQYSY